MPELLKDPWLVAAMVGFLCLFLDVLGRVERGRVASEVLSGLPMMYIPVACALLTEGRSNREYMVFGILFLLAQFGFLQLYHKYGGGKSLPGVSLAVASTAVFVALWHFKPIEPHITIISPKKIVTTSDGRWANVVLKIEPAPASDEKVQVFVRTGDEKWWPCQPAHAEETSRWIAKCGFGKGDAATGNRFWIGALYGTKEVDQGLSDSVWTLLKSTSEIEEVQFEDKTENGK